ncbi:GDSL-type esterase/lipase family protein [Dehalobacter sp. DCM]|uniref:GDSL-type esterase/lipase family protein n=1 Tax=Dehalobacter sp. DCM TaxID=2907827 RepID=UPI0030815424|nr:GDSL-type esterase/lipase family protein [Dehalobacter sp. DCM]
MRTYRLMIRIIQLSIVMTAIVIVMGYFDILHVGQLSFSFENYLHVQNNDGNITNPGTDSDNTAEKPSTNPDDGTAANNDGTNTKIVCLGDSFTYGYPGEPSASWPQRVGDVLKIEVINAGKTYQNASDLLNRFDQDVTAQKPGKVVIFAGVGDAIRGTSLADYQNSIKALVEKAKANDMVPVLALPIPYKDTDVLYKQYREWEVAYAQENKITVLDFKNVLFDSEDHMLSQYTDNGTYPNKAGYQAMGDYAATVLK